MSAAIDRLLKKAGMLPAFPLLCLALFLGAGISFAQAQDSAPDSFEYSLADSDFDPQSALRVELRAPTMVMLSAPVPGRLAVVAVRDGQEVKKDDLLIQIDDRLHQLRLDIATASYDQAVTQLKVVRKLHKLGSRGALDVEMAQANLKGVEAEMKLAAEMVSLCRVTAPWDGRVSQLEVKENQHVPEGAPLLEITEDGPMEAEFMIPSSWLASFKPGVVFQVQVDETGQNYPAVVDRLGGKIDSLTQSIKVYGRLTGTSEGLLPGMSGIAVVADMGNDQP